jgi:hypothetical protein
MTDEENVTHRLSKPGKEVLMVLPSIHIYCLRLLDTMVSSLLESYRTYGHVFSDIAPGKTFKGNALSEVSDSIFILYTPIGAFPVSQRLLPRVSRMCDE